MTDEINYLILNRKTLFEADRFVLISLAPLALSERQNVKLEKESLTLMAIKCNLNVSFRFAYHVLLEAIAAEGNV